MGKDLKGKDLGKGFSQRRDGRYEARAVINGIKVCIYNMNLAQLKKDFELEKAKVLRKEKNVRPNVTLREWFNEWFETCKAPQLKSESSRRVYYRRGKNTYVNLLGDKRVEDISQINIQAATNDLIDAGYKERTVREALGSIRECLDVAKVNGMIQHNPCVSINIQNFNYAMAERRVLEKWEQELFLQEIENGYYNEAYRFLLSTGLRIGEFSGLQWGDIDWDKKIISIQRTMSTAYINGKKTEQLVAPKTSNAYRKIPFFGETEQILKSWKEKQLAFKAKLGDRWRGIPEHGNLIWTTTMGSPITRYVIVHDIKRVEINMQLKEDTVAAREGREPRKIKHIHPHAFRHTFATRCFEKGLDPLVIQNIMGHANYGMTISYTHIVDDKRKEEANKAGNFLE